MNIDNPILELKKDITLPDESLAEVIGSVFDKPIFKTGELVYTMVWIRRKDNKNLWGIAYYRDPMETEELQAKIDEVAENPVPFKLL